MEEWEGPYELPIDYDQLEWMEIRAVRLQYIALQDNKCMYCKKSLDEPPAVEITDNGNKIDWELFPGGIKFLKYPVHLDHDHDTGMTRGAVHSYCNAYMYQYEGR